MSASSRMSCVLLAAVLAGCAGAPKTDQAAERASRIQADLSSAVRLVEIARTGSLTSAAQLLTGQELKGETAAADLSVFASRLWVSLYPELQDPLPGATPGALADSAPASSKFFAAIGPALSLLTAGPVPDDDHAAGILDGLTTADDLNADSILPPYLRALLLERQGRPADAIRPLYEECLHRDPSFYPAKLGIINAAIDQGTAAAELPLLTKYAGELPTAAAQQTAMARISLAAGKQGEAADAAAHALLLAPDSSDLLLLRAKAFEDMGDWYQALSILDSLATIAPNNAAAQAERATILFEKAGNPDGAMKILSEVEPKFPNDPAFPELRGRILLARGNSVEGEAALQAALRLDPTRASTLALLAGAAARAGRWQEADGYLQRVPERQRTPELLKVGWQISMQLADYDGALAYAGTLEKAGGDESLLFRVRTLVAAGKAKDAQELATADLLTVKTPEVRGSLYFLRATAARQAGAGDDAVLADLRAALKENPDDGEALLAIADALSSGHEYRKALAYLKHAQELSPDDADIRARVSEAARLAEPGN